MCVNVSLCVTSFENFALFSTEFWLKSGEKIWQKILLELYQDYRHQKPKSLP